MRVQIVENDGFTVLAELEPATSPAGHYSLRFLTTWANAKDPNSEQVKASVLLKSDGLVALRELIDSVCTDSPGFLAKADQLRLLNVACASTTGALVEAYERARDELYQRLGDGPEFREARDALWSDHALEYAKVRGDYADAVQHALRVQR